jgi:hypothetical protein
MSLTLGGMKAFRRILLALALSILIVPAAPASGLQRVTVYVQNPTSRAISFLYRMGGDDWTKYVIQSGYTLTMTGIADHYIRFDNGHHRTIQYRLTPGSTDYFAWSNGVLDVRHR